LHRRQRQGKRRIPATGGNDNVGTGPSLADKDEKTETASKAQASTQGYGKSGPDGVDRIGIWWRARALRRRRHHPTSRQSGGRQRSRGSTADDDEGAAASRRVTETWRGKRWQKD
jgi:hypothetical protein